MNEWISVKEHLPELDEYVLGWDGERIEKCYRITSYDDNWYWTYYDCMEWNDVTHWMRLPEPPK